LSASSALPPDPPAPSAPKKSFGGRWTYFVLIVALLFVLMPFLLWNATWFGKPLNDDQMSKALNNRLHPREIQHALAQIEQRIESGDPTVKRWYPDIVRLSSSKIGEIRVTAAWVMGQDDSVPEFHQALTRLLTDPQPMVERNAALGLVRFHDDSGHAQILAMLRPYALLAPESGKLSQRLRIGDVVNPGTLVAHIEQGSGKQEVRTAVPGTIDLWQAKDGSQVTAGQPLLQLTPSQEMVWEALRALYLIGRTEDLDAIAPYVRSVPNMPPQVQQQALDTERAIRSRS
jgi:biotin carboxyl carrier protein